MISLTLGRKNFQMNEDCREMHSGRRHRDMEADVPMREDEQTLHSALRRMKPHS